MISIVIPTRNEARQLPAMLAKLADGPNVLEIVVVDAGSGDGTTDIALAQGARVIHTKTACRAQQMNLGASASHGDVIVFLHADTFLLNGALDAMEHALQIPGTVGGAFIRHFQSDSLVLKLTCLFGNLRSRSLGWFFGDQGIFVRRSAFDELGGFRVMDLFEDLDFSRRLKCRGRVAVVKPGTISSPRRFALRGPIRGTLRDLWLTLLYLLGQYQTERATDLNSLEVSRKSVLERGLRRNWMRRPG